MRPDLTGFFTQITSPEAEIMCCYTLFYQRRKPVRSYFPRPFGLTNGGDWYGLRQDYDSDRQVREGQGLPEGEPIVYCLWISVDS